MSLCRHWHDEHWTVLCRIDDLSKRKKKCYFNPQFNQHSIKADTERGRIVMIHHYFMVFELHCYCGGKTQWLPSDTKCRIPHSPPLEAELIGINSKYCFSGATQANWLRFSWYLLSIPFYHCLSQWLNQYRQQQHTYTIYDICEGWQSGYLLLPF